jgi:hypothetical protein
MQRFVLALLLLVASLTFAQAQCVAPNAEGQRVVARESFDPFMSGTWAVSNYDGNGNPTITYGPSFNQLPAVMQRFTRLHECGHLNSNMSADEFEANCYALKVGGWSKGQIREIANYIKSIPFLGFQYGGSGFAFWAGTVAKCPELADTENG